MFAITHVGRKETTDSVVYHENKYRVVNDDHSLTFTGTYTQCLIFIGALEQGKAPLTARNFALSIYK